MIIDCAHYQDGRRQEEGAVPLEEAADSLRWAVRTLALAEDGIITDGRVTMCEEHLLTLWLMTDPRITWTNPRAKSSQSLRTDLGWNIWSSCK